MKEIIKNIYSDKIATLSVNGSVALLIITLITVAITYRLLPPFLPLYNKMAWGYTRIGNTYEIFIPILIAIIFLVINSYFGVAFQRKIPLLARFLFLTALGVTIFTAIFIFKLLLVIL